MDMEAVAKDGSSTNMHIMSTVASWFASDRVVSSSLNFDSSVVDIFLMAAVTFLSPSSTLPR